MAKFCLEDGGTPQNCPMALDIFLLSVCILGVSRFSNVFEISFIVSRLMGLCFLFSLLVNTIYHIFCSLVNFLPCLRKGYL